MDLLSVNISDEHTRHAMSSISEVANYVVKVALLRSTVGREKASMLAFSSFLLALRESKASILNPEQYKSVLSIILSFGFATPDEIAIVAPLLRTVMDI